MKTHKRNNHLIIFHVKGMVAWPETYIYILIYIYTTGKKYGISSISAAISIRVLYRDMVHNTIVYLLPILVRSLGD